MVRDSAGWSSQSRTRVRTAEDRTRGAGQPCRIRASLAGWQGQTRRAVACSGVSNLPRRSPTCRRAGRPASSQAHAVLDSNAQSRLRRLTSREVRGGDHEYCITLNRFKCCGACSSASTVSANFLVQLCNFDVADVSGNHKTMVRFRPAFLAWYKAVSAIAKISFSESAPGIAAVAPTLTVMQTSEPVVRTGWLAIASRIRSAP
jgi:hypothetical protein